jgi:hypothetical protein
MGPSRLSVFAQPLLAAWVSATSRTGRARLRLLAAAFVLAFSGPPADVRAFGHPLGPLTNGGGLGLGAPILVPACGPPEWPSHFC